MDKQTAVNPHNGKPLSSGKELLPTNATMWVGFNYYADGKEPDTECLLCDTIFMKSEKEVTGDKSQKVAVGTEGVTRKGHGIAFCGYGDVPCLVWGGENMNAYNCQTCFPAYFF